MVDKEWQSEGRRAHYVKLVGKREAKKQRVDNDRLEHNLLKQLYPSSWITCSLFCDLVSRPTVVALAGRYPSKLLVGTAKRVNFPLSPIGNSCARFILAF